MNPPLQKPARVGTRKGFGMPALRAAGGDLVDDGVEVGVAGAEFAGDEIAAASGDFFAVDDDVELAGATGRANGIDAEALLDKGRETRDLRAVVVSRGAVNNFDFHGALLAIGRLLDLVEMKYTAEADSRHGEPSASHRWAGHPGSE